MEEVLLIGSNALLDTGEDIHVSSFCLASAGTQLVALSFAKTRMKRHLLHHHQNTTLALVMELLLDVESLQFVLLRMNDVSCVID
jgi:hypothetical protein